MKRILSVSLVVLASGCTNFELLVEECVAEGRCGNNGGTGGGGTATLPPELSADQASLEFGSVTSGQKPRRRLIVSNLDGGIAESLTINLGGPDSDDFTVTSSLCASLTVGQTCPVDVEFSPATTMPGVREAALVVNASRGASLDVPLHAALVPALTVQSALDFGDVLHGTTKTLQLQVTNNLPEPGNLVPTVAAPFFVAMNGCASVGAGQSCVVSIGYMAGNVEGNDEIAVMYLDVGQNRANVVVSGRSVAPGQLLLSPVVLLDDAGAAVERGTSRDYTFTVQNIGTQRIKHIGYVVTGDAWSVASPACSSLDLDASCQGVLRFAPPTLGFYELSFTADAGVIGSDQRTGVGRGIGFAQLSLQIMTPDAGSFVTHSIDGGVCAGSCSYSVWSDPLAPPTVQLIGSPLVLYSPVQFQPVMPGCDREVCDLALDRDRSITAGQEGLPIAFLTPPTKGDLGGLAGADARCQALAIDAGLSGNYLALMGLADGGAGFHRVNSTMKYVWSDGKYLGRITNDAGTNFLANVWTGAGTIYTCNDWTSGTVSNNAYVQTGLPGTVSSFICSQEAQVLCFSESGAAITPVAGAWSIIATETSTGLGSEFAGDCGDAGALIGWSEVRPYYATTSTPACQSLGVTATRLAGGLFRADGVRLLPDSRQLASCTPVGFTPSVLAPVAFAVSIVDGGVGPADSRPVKSVGEGNSITNVSGTTNCTGWTSNASNVNHRNYGNATFTGVSWWSSGNYVNCSGGYIYCVGR